MASFSRFVRVRTRLRLTCHVKQSRAPILTTVALSKHTRFHLTVQVACVAGDVNGEFQQTSRTVPGNANACWHVVVVNGYVCVCVFRLLFIATRHWHTGIEKRRSAGVLNLGALPSAEHVWDS